MNPKYEKLKNLLKELFQLDRPDLDFGLYRVMHAKSGEVTQFLEKDLLPQVQAAFGQYQTADKAELEKALAKVMAGIEAAGMDHEQSPKVAELRAQLQNEAVDLGGLESEVYDQLYSFFRRYYSEGDFLAKRVYKAGVYAIPYEGEEVTLHWANKDQYYIKTSEYLRDYAFRLRPEDDQKPLRVHFRLVDATEGEHGNVRAVEGKDRVFILAAEDFIAQEDGEQGQELSIHFEYRPATLGDWPEDLRAGKSKPPTQKELTSSAVKRILGFRERSVQGSVFSVKEDNPPPSLLKTESLNPENYALWLAELAKPHTLASGEQAEYSRLEAHLKRYTARNTFDYFIHKDLGTFLRRELDFFIKNEVMHLDDVENETAPRVEQYLSKIKIIRKIGGKIIDFLAQLEDFQKKLWLKKKFVVETQWCIRVGCIPEEFHPEIATNDAQREEWERLHGVQGKSFQGSVFSVQTGAVQEENPSPSPLKTESLNPENSIQEPDLFTENQTLEPENLFKAYATLVVDTRHFDVAFTARLLEAMGDVDAQTDGVLFHSENFQALSLMQERYREQVKCIYIDPPYNTDASAILYKNDYKHSSWLSLLQNRIFAALETLKSLGTLCVAIDDEEVSEARRVLDRLLPKLLGIAVVRSNPQSRKTTGKFSPVHEYALFYGASPEAAPGSLELTEKRLARYPKEDEKGRFSWMNFIRTGNNDRR
ncbi:MAG: DNA methyltransferase [Methylococcus sp.]